MDKIKELLNKGLDWWKNFSTKQRMIIISVMASVLLALGILAVVVSKPKMDTLIICEDTAQASQVKDLLEDNGGIKYEIESDNLTFKVDSKDMSDAALLLGSNSIPAYQYDINNVFDGGFSSTESDKNKKFQLYMENNIKEKLESLENVKTAQVKLSIPEDDGTIIASNEDTYASVIVELEGEMSEDQAAGLAQFIATAVGNDGTDNVLIMDSSTNVLFSGGDSASATGVASSQLSYKSKEENRVKGEVKDVILGSGVYDNVEVGMNLPIDFDQNTSTKKEYSVADGREEGFKKSESVFESESENGATAGTPGTDTNDDTTYMTQDGNTSSSSTSDRTTDYALNEEVTTNTNGVGDIKYDESSLTVVANQYKIYDEATLKKDGTLDGMTFDEFKAANDTRTKLDVDQDLYTAVATATGVSAENITIMAYEIPFFQYEDDGSKDIMDYLPIALAVLIFALLGFVVFKSTRKDTVTELEPELSVESLLETTKEAQEQLEDIGFNDKSEARLLIEKFVDENPEAVASLLRNWLNEEWE